MSYTEFAPALHADCPLPCSVVEPNILQPNMMHASTRANIHVPSLGVCPERNLCERGRLFKEKDRAAAPMHLMVSRCCTLELTTSQDLSLASPTSFISAADSGSTVSAMLTFPPPAVKVASWSELGFQACCGQHVAGAARWQGLRTLWGMGHSVCPLRRHLCILLRCQLLAPLVRLPHGLRHLQHHCSRESSERFLEVWGQETQLAE